MGWECFNCGQINPGQGGNCKNCLLDFAKATAFMKRKKMCAECGHRHLQNTFCHVYTEAAEGIDFDEEKDYLEDRVLHRITPAKLNPYLEEDDDDLMDIPEAIKNLIKSTHSVDIDELEPLKTPEYVRIINFTRCNCSVGVPSNSRKFEPIPKDFHVGEIKVRLYQDILSSLKSINQSKNRVGRITAFEENKRLKQENISNLLPSILQFLELFQCANVACVDRSWNRGTNLYKDYIDIRNFSPFQVFRPHQGSVDAMLFVGKNLYTAGDRRLCVTPYLTLEQRQAIVTNANIYDDMSSVVSKEHSTVTSMEDIQQEADGSVPTTASLVLMRDSGNLVSLLCKDNWLFACSSNGSIRAYALSHDPSKLTLARTLWGHTKGVKEVICALPSEDICETHGIFQHVCHLYTISDDRTIRRWDCNNFDVCDVIEDRTIGKYTYCCVTQSHRHIMAGTTNSKVMIYSKLNHCERTDMHHCSSTNAIKTHCLQVTLSLPDPKAILHDESYESPRYNYTVMDDDTIPSIEAIDCCGYNHSFTHLWVGDSCGRIAIWEVPDSGLEYRPFEIWWAHKGCVRGFCKTWRNLISIGDDGVVLVHCLSSFMKIRSLNVLEWCVDKHLISQPKFTSKPFEIKYISRSLKSLSLSSSNTFTLTAENAAECHDSFIIAIGTNYGDVILLPVGTYM
jgi:WD40 repeat protein